MARRTRWPLWAALGVAAATAAFAHGIPARDAIPLWLGLVAASAVALFLLGRRWMRGRPSPRALTLGTLGVAALLRLAALAAPPSLSDDVHRYVWDGALVAQGVDPYAHRPSEVATWSEPPVDPASLSELNSPDYYSVYPPLAQLTFGAAWTLGDALDVPAERLLRGLFSLADLLAIWALMGLLGQLGRPRGWALLYAWNPLVYWEVAAGGHTEALMVPLLLLAVGETLKERPARAGAYLGLAASAKLTALILGPVFLVHLARRLGAKRAAPFALASFGVVAAAFVPFASESLWPHLRESLSLYAERFSFNAPVYYAARDLMGYVEGVTPPVDAALMPWLSAATIGWLLVVALGQDDGQRRFVGSLAAAFVGYLILSRVIHPWYVLPVLALGVLAGSRGILALSLLLPLSYLRYGPGGSESADVIAAQFVPFVALILADAIRAWLAETKRTPRVAPSAEPAPAPPHVTPARPVGYDGDL
ncbi:MAG: glycosyltransferase 87 family protein [Sandaracinaceae bacterium]